MADTRRVDVRNVTDGPKLFNSLPPAVIPAGHDRRGLEVTPGELAAARATGWFEVGAERGDPPALSNKAKAELLRIAADEAVTVADDATNAQIVAAIEAKRNG